MGVPAQVQFDSRYEWGLRLPNGRAIWSPEKFYGTDYQTPTERALIQIAIRDALSNMSLPEGPLLDQYKWLKREVQVITIEHEVGVFTHDIDDPTIVSDSAPSTEVPDVYPEVLEPKGFVQGGLPFEDQQYR